MGLFGKPDIEKIKAKKDVKGLICLLYNRDYEIKRDAVRALGELKDARAVRPLFESSGEVLSSDAKYSIIKIGQPAVGPLLEMLKEGAKISRYLDIVEILGRIADPAAIGPLINSLNNLLVQEKASIALQRIGLPAVEPLIAALKNNRNAADVLIKIGNSSAVEPLAAMLSSGDPEECSSAAIVLGHFGDIRALDALLALLKDGQPDVRHDVARILAKYKDKRVIMELGTLLCDPDQSVRVAAAETLSKSGSADAVRHLIALIQDSNRSVRWEAASVLGSLNYSKSKAALFSDAIQALVLALNDEANEVSQAAVAALSKICAGSYLPLISVLKKDHYRSLRQVTGILEKAGWQPSKDEAGAAYWAAKTNWDKCVEIGVPAVPQLLEAVQQSDDSFLKVVDSLVKIGVPAVEQLITSLGDDNALVREASAQALGTIGDHRAVEPLIVLLGDRGEKPRKVAVNALGKIGDIRALVPLIALLGDDKLFFDVSDALAHYGQQASDALLDVLSKGAWRAKVNAACVLGRIREPRAVVPLLSMCSRGDGFEKAMIAEALGNIGDIRAFETLMAGFMDERLRSAEDFDYSHKKFLHSLEALGTPAKLQLYLQVLYSGSLPAALALAEMDEIASRLLCEDSKDVLQWAARMWIIENGMSVVETLIFRIAQNPGDALSKQLLVEIIGKHGKPVIDRLTMLFRDEGLVRYAIVSVLRQLNNAQNLLRELDAVHVLTLDLYSSNMELRRSAYFALGDLPGWQPKDDAERRYLDKIREQVFQEDAAERFTELNRKYASRP